MINHNDRTPTQPGRRRITPENGSPPFYATVDYADDPADEGALVNKAMLDQMLAACDTTSGTPAALTLIQPGFSRVDGAYLRARVHVDVAGAATLDVQSTGAAQILNAAGRSGISIKAGAWVSFIYSEDLNAYIAQFADLTAANLEEQMPTTSAPLGIDRGGTEASTRTGSGGAIAKLFPEQLSAPASFMGASGSFANTGYMLLPDALKAIIPNISYSTTAPTGTYVGQLWLKPV